MEHTNKTQSSYVAPPVEDLTGKPANHDTRAYDVFSLPPSLGASEIYISTHESPKSVKNQKQMSIRSPKTGNGNDATFSPFISLAGFDSEKYAKNKKEPAKRPVIVIPFKYSNPTKKPCGAGSSYGCFNKFEYSSEEAVSKNITKPKTVSMKNVLVGCPKKTFSAYPYLSPEIQSEKKTSNTRSSAPFRGQRVGGLFDNNVYRSVEMKERSINPRSTRPASAGMLRELKGAKTPFIPPSPSKSGWVGTIGKYPEHFDDGRREKVVRPSSSSPVFRPVGRSTFEGPQPSIIYLNRRFIHLI